MHKENEKNYWLQVGLKMFAESSGWIAVPIVGALFLGRWLDNKYDSQPLFFLCLVVLAFIISSVGIARVGIKYMKMIEKNETNSHKTQPNVQKRQKDKIN